MRSIPVIPANAGIHCLMDEAPSRHARWVPAFAGTTLFGEAP